MSPKNLSSFYHLNGAYTTGVECYQNAGGPANVILWIVPSALLKDKGLTLFIEILSWSSPQHHASYSSSILRTSQMTPIPSQWPFCHRVPSNRCHSERPPGDHSLVASHDTGGWVQRFEQSVVCTIMTANTTNRYDNSVCPYFPAVSIFVTLSGRAMDRADCSRVRGAPVGHSWQDRRRDRRHPWRKHQHGRQTSGADLREARCRESDGGGHARPYLHPLPIVERLRGPPTFFPF